MLKSQKAEMKLNSRKWNKKTQNKTGESMTTEYARGILGKLLTDCIHWQPLYKWLKYVFSNDLGLGRQ